MPGDDSQNKEDPKTGRFASLPEIRGAYNSAQTLTSAANANLTAAERGLSSLSNLLRNWNNENELERRVLLLDDNVAFRTITSMYLSRKLNVEVDEAGTVSEALSLWEEHRHAVLLVDLVLPDDDATAAVEFVRKVGRGPGVIFITGCELSMIGEALQHVSRNIDAMFLQKPIQNLAEVVGSLLQKWDERYSFVPPPPETV